MTAASLDPRILLFRLLVALGAGAAVGWNRQVTGKPAGLRTHMLVSMGSALFVLVPVALGQPEDAISRAIQGVATGVGFLGAGDIVRHSIQGTGKEVPKNLTSAAVIWLTAALGIAAGCGLWQLSAIAAGLTLVTLVLVKRLESVLHRKHGAHDEHDEHKANGDDV